MDRNYKVYKHTSPSGKVYIGITGQENINKRWRPSGYKENPYLKKAIDKYGWDAFTHEILYSGLTKEEAEQKEIELITEYDSLDHSKGYNILLGGGHTGRATQETKDKMSAARMGHPTSEETKRKISEAHRGVPLSDAHLAGIREAAKKRRGKPLPEETRRKLSEAMSGRVRSEEHCRHLSLAKMGHTHAEETKRKISEAKCVSAKTPRGKDNQRARAVICIDTGEVFDTVTLAAISVGTSGSNITACCRGRRMSGGGYHWRYADEDAQV